VEVGSNACAAAAGWRIEPGALGGVDGPAHLDVQGDTQRELAGPPVGVGLRPDQLPAGWRPEGRRPARTGTFSPFCSSV
jgi:hypothetical protein